MKSKNWFVIVLLAFGMVVTGLGQVKKPDVVDIDQYSYGTTVKAIPVSMTGFSGEVESVLRFDLEVAGMTFSGEKPQYLITGSNNGNVKGQVMDALAPTGKPLLSKTYTGSSQRALAHALANDIILAITGQKGIAGTKIAYMVDRGNVSEIHVADFDGHGSVAVTADGSQAKSPAWVPGRRHIFYSTRRPGGIQIMSHNLSTGARQVFAGYSGSNYSPAVSPDGTKVAMVLTKNGSPDVFVCNIDGSGLRQLTKSTDDESSPCWSPDSSTICYVGRSGKRAALFTISASGGSPKQLTVRDSLNLTEPDWSPDGKQIAFTRMMGGFEVCVVPATGGTSRPLVSGEDPSWAPNSRTIIFTRRTNNKRVLSLLDVPTKRVKDVAQISGSCSQPSWSR